MCISARLPRIYNTGNIVFVACPTTRKPQLSRYKKERHAYDYQIVLHKGFSLSLKAILSYLVQGTRKKTLYYITQKNNGCKIYGLNRTHQILLLGFALKRAGSLVKRRTLNMGHI